MSTQWYLYKDQQQTGPMTWEQLLEKGKAGAVGPADMIWTEGMPNWTRADQVKGLIPAVPPPNPAYSPPPPGVQASQQPSNISYQHAPSAYPGAGSSARPGSTAAAGVKSSTGLEPNIAGLLSYILGWITGIIFFLIESENKFVRFHAMQSIITFGGLTVLQVLISILNRLLWSFLWRGVGSWAMYSTLTGLLGIISIIIWLATLGLAVLLMIKAYQYETFKLPIAGNIAEKQLQ